MLQQKKNNEKKKCIKQIIVCVCVCVCVCVWIILLYASLNKPAYLENGKDKERMYKAAVEFIGFNIGLFQEIRQTIIQIKREHQQAYSL